MARNVSPAARLYQARAGAVRDRFKNIAVGRFDALGSWAQTDPYATTMARLSTQAQMVQAGLLRSMVTTMSGERVDLDVAAVVGDSIRGGDIAESWRIPFYSLWSAAAGGQLDQDALVAQGRDDVEAQAVTDLSLSQRATAQELGRASGNVIGFWRVPNEGSACEFCVEISTRLYYVEDLMPVHPNCECSVEPAMAGEGDGGGD